ncbi:MAG: DUF3365 domain-containing protein [Chloroflexi bacterium]|nr:DUF3365 domain-containing protein [Chloroflexota bacterium]
MRQMNLRTRFTLIISIIFVAAFIAAWAIFTQVLQRQAEDEIRTRSMALMDLLGAVRTYTSEHVNPLLVDDLDVQPNFIPETVPAYSAQTVFDSFRSARTYSGSLYKEAALNPTNLDDIATDFEAAMIASFAADPSQLELSGFTTVDDDLLFYNARPLAVTTETCLRCHGDPAAAPASLINTYGSANGFGWQLGEVVAIRMLYVPAEEVFSQRQQALGLVMGILVVVFVVVVVAINVVLRRTVVRPVIQIARLANLIITDRLTLDSPEVDTVRTIARRSDEFGDTAKVIEQMASEIHAREARLKQEIRSLRIQIDSEKQAQQVEAITDSDYFRHLQKRVTQIRGGTREHVKHQDTHASQPEIGTAEPDTG